MSKAIPILGIVAIITAILTALVFVGIGLLVPALIAIGLGITLTVSSNWKQIVPGVSAIIFGILGIMGALNNISTDGGGGVSFGISEGIGIAFIVVALLEIAGASIILSWDQLEPEWLSYVFVALWALCFILAFVLESGYSIQNGGKIYGLVVPVFLMMAAPIMHLREA